MKEKVLLAVVDLHQKLDWPVAEVARELEELVEACGAEVIEKVFCPLKAPSASTLIGEGKVQEIANLCQTNKVDTVIFSHDLKGSQQRNLEETIMVKTIDRTQLILDIFARRARTRGYSNRTRSDFRICPYVSIVRNDAGAGTLGSL